MNRKPTIKFLIGLALSLAVVFFMSACNNKADNPNELIAGKNSKTWYPEKQTNSSGEKEDLTKEEKKESWVFYTNGTFAMNMVNESMHGKWSYDAASKTLTVNPDGQPGSSFTVTSLDDNEMKLQTPDGSTMKLETD